MDKKHQFPDTSKVKDITTNTCSLPCKSGVHQNLKHPWLPNKGVLSLSWIFRLHSLAPIGINQFVWTSLAMILITKHSVINPYMFFDFAFLPYISFIIVYRALECIKRYWETIYEESEQVRFITHPPLSVKPGFCVFALYLLYFCFYLFIYFISVSYTEYNYLKKIKPHFWYQTIEKVWILLHESTLFSFRIHTFLLQNPHF